jgi:hypothetical protein
MKRYINYLFFVLLSLLILVFILSCSEETGLISVNDKADTVDEYFPLEPGTASQYKITNNIIESVTHITFTLGGEVTLNGLTLYPWLSQYVEYPSFKDTGYIVHSDNAIYFYENEQAQAEKILETPFEVGHTWTRFEPVTSLFDTNNFIDIVDDDYFQQKEDTSAVIVIDSVTQDDDNIKSIAPGKNYPTIGSNYFQITAIEDVELENGAIYKNCIRVENKSREYTNYYWYGKNVGLVKYANNVKSDEYPEGQVTGEISAKRQF